MSQFPERDSKALLVIDVQNDVVEEAWRREMILENINTMIAKAREANTPVIWVQHSDPFMEIGSELWQIVDELQPLPEEPIIRKKFRSSFEDTELEATLEKLGVGHLVITGAQTDYCVRHTAHAALERGYDVTLIKDAHTTSDSQGEIGRLSAEMIVDEMNQSFRKYRLPGRFAETKETKEFTFAPAINAVAETPIPEAVIIESTVMENAF